MLEGDPPKKNHEIREFWEQNFTILEPPESRFSELPGVFSLSLSLCGATFEQRIRIFFSCAQRNYFTARYLNSL